MNDDIDYFCYKSYQYDYLTFEEQEELEKIVLENKEFEDVLTVNLAESPTDRQCAFIDTNNVKYAEKFLQENKIAQPTGRYAISGFCTYPEYRFDMTKLKSYEDESDEDMEM